jgi:hypothetical protein
MTADERSRAEQGLHEALDRVRERTADPSRGDPLISVAEVLTWCKALEDGHKKRIPSYFADRDGDDDGRALAGLMYARNLVQHQLATVGTLFSWPTRMTRQTSGRGGSVTHISGGGTSFEWNAFGALPDPDKPSKTHDRDVFYRDRVERRLLATPLEAAERFLRGRP